MLVKETAELFKCKSVNSELSTKSHVELLVRFNVTGVLFLLSYCFTTPFNWELSAFKINLGELVFSPSAKSVSASSGIFNPTSTFASGTLVFFRLTVVEL